MNLAKLGGDIIFFGEDAVGALSTELASTKKRAFIVMTGNILDELGLLKPVTDALEKGGFTWEKFTDIEEDATFTSIKKGIEAMKKFEPDWIIGFGGGSAMDAAKTMWIFYENPEVSELAEVAAPKTFAKLREKAKLCCIPTSAGTGSEVTRLAVVKDVDKLQKFVIVCRKGRMIPDVAILDPQFSLTMPKGLTSSTGIDAITHAIESYTSTTTNPYSEGPAMAGLKLAFEYLPTAYENGKDPVAREKMLIAANLAGMAFANSLLGIVHSIAHSFGGEFGVPHGLANAITLPYIIEFHKSDEKVSERYRQLANLLGSNSLLESVKTLNDKVDIPKGMKDFIRKRLKADNDEAFEKHCGTIVEKAKKDIATLGAPVKPTDEQWEELVKLAYYGK
ncbi:MAG: iron-containing alcohol dehydrogenase [Synergistaceae bacterium]|jgi:alcohol dehydrogenase class IV|nr:iron-containing alcohol dehydrogenase [Synergistaceae bacterium]